MDAEEHRGNNKVSDAHSSTHKVCIHEVHTQIHIDVPKLWHLIRFFAMTYKKDG